jgi:hypothetical protein
MPRIPGWVLLTATISGMGQTPDPGLRSAWTTYAVAAGRVEGEPGYTPEGGLAAPLEALGRAWGTWVTAQPVALRTSLPPGMEADRTGLPQVALRTRRGPWSLLGLEVPVPCGSHTFLALIEDTARGARLRLLDLRNPPREGDALGAREGVVTLLLSGGRVVTASTPPWCTSCWSRLDVRVLAPSGVPDAPRLLATFEDGVYRCADDGVVKLSAVNGAVNVDYTGHADPARIFRKRRHRLSLRK